MERFLLRYIFFAIHLPRRVYLVWSVSENVHVCPASFRETIHSSMSVWTHEAGSCGSVVEKEKDKKCNIIDSAVTTVSCHMELNPVIHKCVWRNEHVSMHGMSGQLAHVNDCAENCSSASLCTKPYEWKGTFHSWCKSWYCSWCGTDVNEKRTAWNWWQPRG